MIKVPMKFHYLAIWSLLVGLSHAAPEKLPNILFILADDLGYGDVSCYNPEAKIPTPRLDRLAAEGMRFTDAHSPSTVCTPSRYSLLTGRMAFRTGKPVVFTGAGGPNLIEAGRLTLPEMLRQKGYYTAMTGKWHIGLTFQDTEGKPVLDGSPEAIKRIDWSRPIPDAPIHRGFNQFFGTACCPTTDWLYAFIDGDRVPVPPEKAVDLNLYPKNVYTEDFRKGFIAPDFDVAEIDQIFLRKSTEFLDQHNKQSPEKPFFLLHSTQAVHLPSIPAEAFRDKTTAGPHGDFIAQLDSTVGALLDKLDQLGIAENTIVMISSDNGSEVTTVVNMRKDHKHDGVRPWRGVKRDQWEGGHRVPFIIRWPGKVAAGSVSNQTVCLTDVMATCASIVGTNLPNEAAEDSFDLKSVLLAGDSDQPLRPYTLHQTMSFKMAIRKGPWKYLDHPGSGGNDYHRWQGLDAYILEEKAPDAPGQLYQLGDDPGETTNLYFKHPEIVAELKAQLDQAASSGRSAPLRKQE